MEELRKALFTDIQDIKQEKKHHIGVIFGVSVTYTRIWKQKTEKGSIDMFIFKIKREQAQFTAKNSAQTVHVYIFHNLSIYSCSAEERELKNMLKDIKKYKHKIQIKNNTLLINKLPINSKPHTLQNTCIGDTDTKK